MPVQFRKRELRQINAPIAAFCRNRLDSQFASDFFERLGNGDLSLRKIHVGPRQGEQLPRKRARIQGEQEQGIEPFRGSRGKEQLDLIRIQHREVGPRGQRLFDAQRRVGRQFTARNRVSKRHRQRRADLSHHRRGHAIGSQGRVQLLNVDARQRRQLDAADLGNDVFEDVPFVGPKGIRLNARFDNH